MRPFRDTLSLNVSREMVSHLEIRPMLLACTVHVTKCKYLPPLVCWRIVTNPLTRGLPSADILYLFIYVYGQSQGAYGSIVD
jgi:hypothetical protein